MRFLLLALLLIPLVAAGDEDADFLGARDAFRVGNAPRFEKYASRLKNSPLEPYLEYYRLRMQLKTVDASRVHEFLSRPEDTPVIDRLRGEWLKQLGKGKQWKAFMEEYPHLQNEDAELSCYALQARLVEQEAQALEDARKLWLKGGN